MANVIWLTVPGLPASVVDAGAPAADRPAVQASSFSLEVSNSGTIGGGSTGAGAGKATLGPLVVTLASDAGLVSFFRDVVGGTHLATVTLHLATPEAPTTDLLTLTLTDALVTQVVDDGTAASDAVTVHLEYQALAVNQSSLPTPPPALSEAPLEVALPVAAAAIGAGALVHRHRAAASSPDGDTPA